jgi:hypothetical protein
VLAWTYVVVLPFGGQLCCAAWDSQFRCFPRISSSSAFFAAVSPASSRPRWRRPWSACQGAQLGLLEERVQLDLVDGRQQVCLLLHPQLIEAGVDPSVGDAYDRDDAQAATLV